MNKEQEEIIYCIQSAYDFILNSEIVQSDSQCYIETEEERDKVVNYLTTLFG